MFEQMKKLKVCPSNGTQDPTEKFQTQKMTQALRFKTKEMIPQLKFTFGLKHSPPHRSFYYSNPIVSHGTVWYIIVSGCIVLWRFILHIVVGECTVCSHVCLHTIVFMLVSYCISKY